MATKWKCPRCEAENDASKRVLTAYQSVAPAIKCKDCDLELPPEAIDTIRMQNIFEIWCSKLFDKMPEDVFKKKTNMAYADKGTHTMFVAFSSGYEVAERKWRKMTGLKKV